MNKANGLNFIPGVVHMPETNPTEFGEIRFTNDRIVVPRKKFREFEKLPNEILNKYLRYFYLLQLAASPIRLIYSIPLVGFYFHFDVFIIEMLLCFYTGVFLYFTVFLLIVKMQHAASMEAAASHI